MTVIALGYRKGIIDAVGQLGRNVYCVVEKKKPGLASIPHSIVASLSDISEVLRSIIKADLGDIEAIVTGHEQAVLSTYILRSVFDLPGKADFRLVESFRDKFIQKKGLDDQIKRAEITYVKRGALFDELSKILGSSIIIKPSNGFGSKNTSLVFSQSELDKALESHAESNVGLVAESFVRGKEFHVDGVWHNGELLWAAASAYIEPLINWSTGGFVGSVPLNRGDETASRLVDFTERALQSLAAPDSVFHLEAFITDDGEIYFSEAAIRVAGGLVPECIADTFGIDLFSLAVELALGTPISLSNDQAQPSSYTGWIYLHGNAGVVPAVSDFSKAFPNAELFFPSGSKKQLGSYGHWGHAFIRDYSPDQVLKLMRKVSLFNKGDR